MEGDKDPYPIFDIGLFELDDDWFRSEASKTSVESTLSKDEVNFNSVEIIEREKQEQIQPKPPRKLKGKVCPKCQTFKLKHEYYPRRLSNWTYGIQAYCKVCNQKRDMKNPEKLSRKRMRTKI